MSKVVSSEPSLTKDNSETSLHTKDNTNNHATKQVQQKSNSKNETTAMRQILQQINNLTGTNAGIERQLLSIKNDIKQLTKTATVEDDNLVDDRRSIKQIQSQITQLQMHVSKIDQRIGNVFEIIKSKKNKGGKKKNKKNNKKGKK
jgi:chromosome segregation ATPase